MSGRVPFSFHCIICFEAFDHDERPPVILPCGHTYVCAACSKRLDKCMECREPLFLKPGDLRGGGTGAGAGQSTALEPVGDNEPMPSWYRPPPGRHHDRHHHQKKPPPSKPVERIPLPRNLVMMSLMEAAEQKKMLAVIAKEEGRKQRAVGGGTKNTEPRPPVDSVTCVTAAGIESIEKTDESFRREQDDSTSTSNDDEHDDDDDFSDSDDESSKAYESGDDDSAVRIGMSHLLGTCGTYAVKDGNGLTVLPEHPSRVAASPRPQSGAEDGPPKPERSRRSSSSGSPAASTPSKEPFRLSPGQTVQVSYVDEEGVAVLARGYGYIVADAKQLVKVGAARDKACHIEGTLHSIETKKRWYNKRLTELPLLEKKYASDLGVAMKECGGYPVIGPSPEEASGVNKVDDNDDKNANENKAEASIRVTATDAADDRSRETSPKTTTAYADDDGAAHTSPVRHLSEMTPRTPVTPAAHASPGHNSIIDCSPFTIDNSEIGPFVLSEDSEAGMRPLQIQPNLAPQPLQRQDSNNIVSNFSLGCGFLAGNSYLEHQEDESLVGLSFDSAIDVDRSTHSSSRPNPRSPERVVNRPPEYPRTPDRSFGGLGGGGTASFDTVESSSRVDFRSGYSGHRGLLGAKSHADRMKAEQSRREFRTMGEHRGIGYINSRGIGVASVPSRVGTASSSSRTDRSRASRMSDAR